MIMKQKMMESSIFVAEGSSGKLESAATRLGSCPTKEKIYLPYVLNNFFNFFFFSSL